MWNDKDKDGGLNWWVYELNDVGCTDELGLFYDIEEVDRQIFLNQYIWTLNRLNLVLLKI